MKDLYARNYEVLQRHLESAAFHTPPGMVPEDYDDDDFEEDEDVFDCDGNCDECEFNENEFDPEEDAIQVEKMISNFLLDQKTVAVFNGLAESGPRALGHRSILFDARNPNAKTIVNKIKKREWYRPFAAMVLEEDFQHHFETLGLTKSDFMTVSFTVIDDTISGVTHVDNTCRVQTVSKNIPHIYKLLQEFKKQSGISVLLNTSFNLAGEPLVDTLEDALKTFNDSELDVLWFPEINRGLIK
jgi:carbamoyltransferase